MSVEDCAAVRDCVASVEDLAFAEVSAALATELPISAAAPTARMIASFFIIELQLTCRC
jgi:hypothetical protein